MQIVVVGINQNTAPVAIRERLSFIPAHMPDALAQLHTQVAECFILSTCNRVEIYGVVGHAETGTAILRQFLAINRGVAVERIQPYLFSYAHQAAVEHLFHVAAGLDSMVVGEDQILMQVKDALEAAQAAGTLGTVLHRLGEAALATGKHVRTGTSISRNHLSIVSVGLHLAEAHLGALNERSTLVIGAGRMAELALKHLSNAGAQRVTVTNRTYEKGRDLAERFGVGAMPLQMLEDALIDSDLVVSCTSASNTIVEAELVRRVMQQRQDRPLLFLDLAVPRDVDPDTGAIEGVVLYDVDSLQTICDANRQQRMQEIAKAQHIIEDETGKYMDWWQGREVAPTIAQLRAHAEAIRDAELARVLARLPDLSPREQEIVQSLASGIVNKLLHRPVTMLKSSPEASNAAQVLQELFGLEDTGPAQFETKAALEAFRKAERPH